MQALRQYGTDTWTCYCNHAMINTQFWFNARFVNVRLTSAISTKISHHVLVPLHAGVQSPYSSSQVQVERTEEEKNDH